MAFNELNSVEQGDVTTHLKHPGQITPFMISDHYPLWAEFKVAKKLDKECVLPVKPARIVGTRLSAFAPARRALRDFKI